MTQTPNLARVKRLGWTASFAPQTLPAHGVDSRVACFLKPPADRAGVPISTPVGCWKRRRLGHPVGFFFCSKVPEVDQKIRRNPCFLVWHNPDPTEVFWKCKLAATHRESACIWWRTLHEFTRTRAWGQHIWRFLKTKGTRTWVGWYQPWWTIICKDLLLLCSRGSR